jgi:circadian clock protein KaiC
MLMTSWQATTFLIGEYHVEDRRQPGVHRVLRADLAAPERAAHSMVRKMEVMKMRGQATLPGLHTFRVNAAGLEVFPPRQRRRSDTCRTRRPRCSRRAC